MSFSCGGLTQRARELLADEPRFFGTGMLAFTPNTVKPIKVRRERYNVGMQTTDPKHAVEIALAERRLNQAQLAALLGTHTSTLSRTLNAGEIVNGRSLWPAILDALDLEIVIRSKQEG